MQGISPSVPPRRPTHAHPSRQEGSRLNHFSTLAQAGGAAPRLIGFLAFDGVTVLDMTGPLDAFANARTEEGNLPCYEPVLISVAKRIFVAASGVTLEARYTIRTAPALDTIIIPGGAGLRNSALSQRIAQWLRRLNGTVRRIGAISTGIYPLAESGLLDGRRVTTHWRCVQNVASTFRRLEVDDCGSFIKDDRFYTCGGGTAGTEMTLALIQEDYGQKTALKVARELVVNLKPSSNGERRVIPGADQPNTEERLAELPAWISSRLRAKLSLKVLAERACLCPRHFSRVFVRAFKCTPAEFVDHLRMTEAARRLASRPSSIGDVAESVGYKSVFAFRRAFRRRFGVTPRSFRKNSRTAAAQGRSLRHFHGRAICLTPRIPDTRVGVI